MLSRRHSRVSYRGQAPLPASRGPLGRAGGPTLAQADGARLRTLVGHGGDVYAVAAIRDPKSGGLIASATPAPAVVSAAALQTPNAAKLRQQDEALFDEYARGVWAPHCCFTWVS